MLFFNKDKYIAHTLELRSLRSWFKHHPLIHEFHNCLGTKCFCMYEKNQFNIEKNTQESNIKQPFVIFHKRLIIRNIFESWKLYVIYKLRKRKALCEANHIYRRKLKRNVFNVLSKNIMKCNKHHNATIKRSYFKLWKNYTKVIKRNKSLIEKSQTLYIKRYFQKSLRIWKTFAMHKREKDILQRKLIDKAATLYNSNLLHKSFISWISIHNSIKDFKEQLQMVFYYYKKKVLNKYFFTWIAYYKTKKQNKDLQDKTDRQYCHRLLKRCLKQLILYTNEVHTHRKELKVANTFYEFKILVKIFRAWIQWYYQIVRIRSIMFKIQRITKNKTIRKIFLHWKLCVFNKKCVRRKTSLCLIIYRKKIVKNAFVKLKDYVLYKKRKQVQMLTLHRKEVTIIFKIQSVYMEKWKRVLNMHMQEKCKVFQAIEFYNNYIFKQYLSYWKTFSQHHKVKLLQKQILNERVSFFLLNKCIVMWKMKFEENCKIYDKEKLIAAVIHTKMQKKYFMFWEKYRNKQIQKRRDLEYVKEINKKCLLREGLKEILRSSLFIMQLHHENRIKDTLSKNVENFKILKQYFEKWFLIIHLKEKLGSANLRKISYYYQKDAVISSEYTVNKCNTLNTLCTNDTNNNLYFTCMRNDKSLPSIANIIELLPPSAFY